MQILTEIGEVGVHDGERVHILRPSLYAMTQIGGPEEIVRVFTSVMEAAPSFVDALGVLYACAETDVSGIFGRIEPADYIPEQPCISGEIMGATRYVAGAVPPEHVVYLARCLLKHGVTGALAPLPIKEGETQEYTQTFNAREHVAVAMAHLGLSERDAWQMTMTSFIGAMRAKFPAEAAPGSRAPSVDEYEADMARLDKINAIRDKKELH